MDSGSPWSTPTQSEIGEAETQLKYMNDLKSGMVRELGDGEPSDQGFVTEGSRNESVKSSKSSKSSKSPLPEKVRRASLSPKKGKSMEQTNGETKGARGRMVKQQSLPGTKDIKSFLLIMFY